MTHEQLEKLKQDPTKYEQYRIKHNEDCKKWRDKHKALNDEHYKRFVNAAKRYNKEHPEKTKEANRKSRQKRGPEYIRNYMRIYRANNRNNISQKEKIYKSKQTAICVSLLNRYELYIDEIIRSSSKLRKLYDNDVGNRQLKQYIHKIVEPKLLKCRNTYTNKNITKVMANKICAKYIKNLQNRFN